MNAQMVYEKWKKIVSESNGSRVVCVPAEAERYVLGDDSEFDNIPKDLLWKWEYPKELIAELDGEGAEMAKRCLRTFARLNKGGLYSENNPVLLKRIGFNLMDIMEDGINGFCPIMAGGNYLHISRNIYEAMTEDAEKFITPEYLKNRLAHPQFNTRTLHIAFYIAGYMINDGKGSVKGLSDEILNYADKVSKDTAAVLLRLIYKLDKRFEDRLRELMKRPETINTLWRSNADGIERLAEELGVMDYYMYAGVTQKLGSEECTEYSAKAAESYDKLLPWMFGAAMIRADGAAAKSESNDNHIAELIKQLTGNNAPASEVLDTNTEKVTKRVDELEKQTDK